MALTKPREVLFFASYCGEDNPHCSDKRPCPVCLGMSNIYTIPDDTPLTYVREMSPDWQVRGKIEKTIPDDVFKARRSPKPLRRKPDA